MANGYGGWRTSPTLPSAISHVRSLLHVFLDRLRSHLGAVDVPGAIDGDAFGCARAGEVVGRARPRLRIGDEALNLAVLDRSPADAAMPSVVILRDRLGLRVGDVQDVALDEDAARAAELLVLGDVLAVLIEHLHAIVVAIADEQSALAVERQRVRLIELSRAGTELAPLLDELAGLVELQDPVVAGAVTLGHEDVAVRRGDDVVRLVEVVRGGGAARLAEREEHVAIGAELVDLIAERRARPRTDRAARRFAARASAAAAGPTARTALRQRGVVL